MKNINTKLGENLKRIRKSRNLTMDVLSNESGVSKSMISEIERGIRNPSVTTLWNIANVLKTPLNYFLKDDADSSPSIYRMGDHSSIDGKGYSFHPLMNFDENKRFEIYFNEYKPGCITETSSHYEGVEEFVLVSSGNLDVFLGEEKFNVVEGQVIHFLAEKPHHYENTDKTSCRAFILMFYPK